MKIILLVLLSLLLTGCATDKSRGTYKEEVKEDVVEEAKEEAEEEVVETKDETEDIAEETDIEEAKSEMLYTNSFTNDDNGDTIYAAIDENKKIILIYTPSENVSDVFMYENKCSAAVLLMFGLVKGDSYTLSVSDDKYYCDTLITKSSNEMTVFSSDRDGTTHISTFDGMVGDWLNEAINNPSSVTKNTENLWISETCETIAKEIEGIYP